MGDGFGSIKDEINIPLNHSTVYHLLQPWIYCISNLFSTPSFCPNLSYKSIHNTGIVQPTNQSRETNSATRYMAAISSINSIQSAPVVSLPPDGYSTASAMKAPSNVEMINTPLPRLTFKSLALGTFVSIGGLLFGYDTGQISGFESMPDFLQRYG